MKKIDQLLQKNRLVWRGSQVRQCRAGKLFLPTGFDALDEILPDRGWPAGALVDLLLPDAGPSHSNQYGIGELRLLLPAMRDLVQQKKWLLWISPPHIPYAPALQTAGIDLQRLLVIDSHLSRNNKVWTMEKALQTSGCGMVLCWADVMPMAATRRLQLAAERSGAVAVLFQARKVSTSVAALRLQLAATAAGIQVRLLKARGVIRYPCVELRLYEDFE